MSSVEVMITKAHSKLMRHIETRAMCGIFVSGTNEIVDDGSVATACTDGWNKYYGKAFMEKLTLPEVTGIVLHENLHVFCKHMVRFRAEMKRNPKLMNAAMDYAINGWIVGLKDKSLAVLPEGGLYDPQFADWSVLEIYNFLQTGRDPKGNQQGKPQPKGEQGAKQPDTGAGSEPDEGDDEGDASSVVIGDKEYKLDGHDEHEESPATTPEQAKEMSQRVDTAIQQGAVLAGAMGLDLPRIMKEVLAPEVNWIEELADFAANNVRGHDDYSFRRLNRRYLADDLYVPTMITEVPSEIVISIDTSGSINNDMLKVWGGIVSKIMENVNPDAVRVLWWDTRVHAEQMFFPGDYGQIATLLKPVGGGGTRVSCVSEHIRKHNITADCMIVLTDGWVEHEVVWGVDMPTLWAVTERNDWTPPAGRVLKIKL